MFQKVIVNSLWTPGWTKSVQRGGRNDCEYGVWGLFRVDPPCEGSSHKLRLTPVHQLFGWPEFCLFTPAFSSKADKSFSSSRPKDWVGWWRLELHFLSHSFANRGSRQA